MTACMDLHLSVLKPINTPISPLYLARLVIGKRILPAPENTSEVFWCCASGRNFFACVTAVKERALLWAKDFSIEEISGLTDEEILPVIINTGERITDINPVTYNDWLLEAHLL